MFIITAFSEQREGIVKENNQWTVSTSNLISAFICQGDRGALVIQEYRMVILKKIKLRERIPHNPGPLKLFLDMVPSFSADVTRSLRGCAVFRFRAKETFNASGMPFLDFI